MDGVKWKEREIEREREKATQNETSILYTIILLTVKGK